jgi:hypothetical protein
VLVALTTHVDAAPTDQPIEAHEAGLLGVFHQYEARGQLVVSRRPWMNSPYLPAGILLVLAVVFVLVRLAVAGHGDISTFVQAGTDFVNPVRAPHGLAIRPGSGYDGQFYYRLALEPWNFAWSAHGVTFDFALRRQRIVYSWLTWIFSGGQATAVPYVLVCVNVAMLSLMGFFSGKWAQSLGRHALWGLLPAGYFGIVWSLDRDLTEITTITLVVAGIVAWRADRFVLAGVAFAGAVLSRETAMLVVAALVVTRVLDIVRRRDRIGRSDSAWVIPLVVFAGWQAMCLAVYGTLPLTSEDQNAGIPLSGAIHVVGGWMEHPKLTNLLELIQLLMLITVVILASLHLRDSRSSSFEKLAFVFAVLLLAVLSSSIWNNDPREFRTMVDVFALGSGVLLGSRSFRPLVITGLTWGVWCLVALLSVKYI